MFDLGIYEKERDIENCVVVVFCGGELKTGIIIFLYRIHQKNLLYFSDIVHISFDT